MSRPNNNVRIQLDFAQKCLITESKGTKTISNEKMQDCRNLQSNKYIFGLCVGTVTIHNPPTLKSCLFPSAESIKLLNLYFRNLSTLLLCYLDWLVHILTTPFLSYFIYTVKTKKVVFNFNFFPQRFHSFYKPPENGKRSTHLWTY